MKKNYKILAVLLLNILLLISFFNCTVNESTGLIRVINSTSSPITNIKIGDSLIVSYLGSGYNYDYWYYKTIEGNLSADGININPLQSDWNLKIKPGYWIELSAQYNSNSGKDEISVNVYKENHEEAPVSDWRN